MKKLFLLLSFTFYILNVAFSQNPLVKQWDYRFGGLNDDRIFSFQQTTDGGYILGGYSASDISGDKTQATWGDADYWIIKIDSLGNKQWDKDFGGAYNDKITSVQQTSDGGYILGGFSVSGISGDKTQSTWGNYCDYWIVKTDSLGNKEWDKDFGGINIDYLYSVKQTADKGYILGGTSSSGINGNKTQDTKGGWDYWIVKTDSVGNYQWDKDFGGTGVDKVYSLQQTSDQGYILGGYSSSGINGDKTQTSWGADDFWIVKTDSLGNKQWDKDFGGTNEDQLYSIQVADDGGYILGGISVSVVSGDKTQATWGGYDYWIVKIDSLGNKQWDKDFGGTNNESQFSSVVQTQDNGYLLGGLSLSNIGGDKTENNLDIAQSWIIKVDSFGFKQWDKTLLVIGKVELGLAIQTSDGCYVMADFTDGDIGGDKTQLSQGFYDYWIIKFCDTTSTTSITQLPNPQLPFSIYPNPTSESANIDYSSIKEKIVSISVKNILGETVTNYVHVPENKLQIQTSYLPKGIYFIELSTEKNVFQKKLVVQ